MAAGAIERVIRAMVMTPFDLHRDLPVRASLVRLRDDAWMIVLTLARAFFDEPSLGVIANDLAFALGGRLHGVTRRQPAAALPSSGTWVDPARIAAWIRRGPRPMDERLDTLARPLTGLTGRHSRSVAIPAAVADGLLDGRPLRDPVAIAAVSALVTATTQRLFAVLPAIGLCTSTVARDSQIVGVVHHEPPVTARSGRRTFAGLAGELHQARSWSVNNAVPLSRLPEVAPGRPWDVLLVVPSPEEELPIRGGGHVIARVLPTAGPARVGAVTAATPPLTVTLWHCDGGLSGFVTGLNALVAPEQVAWFARALAADAAHAVAHPEMRIEAWPFVAPPTA